MVVEHFITILLLRVTLLVHRGPYSCENPMFVGCQMSYCKLNIKFCFYPQRLNLATSALTYINELLYFDFKIPFWNNIWFAVRRTETMYLRLM